MPGAHLSADDGVLRRLLLYHARILSHARITEMLASPDSRGMYRIRISRPPEDLFQSVSGALCIDRAAPMQFDCDDGDCGMPSSASRPGRPDDDVRGAVWNDKGKAFGINHEAMSHFV